jgi:myo-inositol-1(or 4)-monophosphatase
MYIKTTKPRFETERHFMIRLAHDAGKIMREGLKIGSKVELKSDNTPVTPSDIKINALVLDKVKRTFPGFDVYSEEGSSLTGKENALVCDPLDGTYVFSKGMPTSVFSLALTIKGEPVVGVIFDPFTKRLFTAEVEEGAHLNGRRIQVSRKNNTLEGSDIGITSFEGEQKALVKLREIFRGLGAKDFDTGSIANNAVYVACGEIAASVHPARKPWDTAAAKVIVEEAGGMVTDLYGNMQRYNGEIKGAIISNGTKVHSQLINLIRAL